MYPDNANGGDNPYDFIMNAGNAPKKKPLATIVPSNNPFVMRIVVLVGGAVALMVVIAIVVSLLSRGGLNTVPLVGMTQTQAELVRVATGATSGATQQSTKNLAINIQLDVTTQQQQLLKYLSAHGRNVNSKELALKMNTNTDLQLTNAKAQSAYDEVFAQLMQTGLQSYANTIKQTYAATSATSERVLLSSFYTQTQLLLSEVPTQASLNAGN